MKSAKRIVCLLLAVLMIASFAACGGQKEAAEKEDQKTAAAPQETEAPVGKYAETVTVHTVAESFPHMKFPEGSDWNSNPFLDQIKDELNIAVKYDWIVDGGQYGNKIATMLVSGKMPDFFAVHGNDYFDLARQDAVMDLKEVYEKYASPLLKQKEADFQEGFDSAFVDGKLYGIPLLGYGNMNSTLFWIRKDWLDQCGLEVPQTMDELHDVAKAFVEECGAAYGITFNKKLTDIRMNTMIPFANAYHGFPQHWIEKDGKVAYGSVQPEVKETLLELQKWYKEGLIDPEFSVKDDTKCRESFASGKCGIMTGRSWMGEQFADSLKNDPNAEWIAVAIPGTDDEPVIYQTNWPVTTYYVVNRNCEHPEAVIKMMNLYVELFDEGYIEECKTKWGLDKGCWPAYQTSPLTDYTANVEIVEAMKTGDESKLSPGAQSHYSSVKKWADEKNYQGYMRYMQHTQAYPILRDIVDNNMVHMDALHGLMPDSYVRVKGTLDQMENEAFVKIIMGEDISTFDTFVENWYKLGGDAAVAEANELLGK